jgi:quinoprotein glucose dehydrogenase
VVAVDAATGETLWMWRPREDAARLENAPRKGAGRGVSYWSDGKSARIFTVTPGFNLAALDAKTGLPVAGFGTKGVVDLMKGMRGAPKSGIPDVGSQSPPLVLGNVVVVGPAHALSFRPRTGDNVKGDVRGFDARTGKLLWTFRTIPQAGDPSSCQWRRERLICMAGRGRARTSLHRAW